MNHKTFSLALNILILGLLAGCNHSSSHPSKPTQSIEILGPQNIKRPLTSKELEGELSEEDFSVGSNTESGERSNADIIDNYGSDEFENDKDYNFEALPPVTPQENGCSGLFCP